eukprot:TRINITY_DN3121_c4_g2_i1.p1 TRINITY_DN3121_c4_g2~~TRINITY_DN3121_c4_g2_i1.p1  ORF type:complete len:271 (-),score=72.87 TRINITY_DN3121_c4_g2_i1:30-806(-)
MTLLLDCNQEPTLYRKVNQQWSQIADRGIVRFFQDLRSPNETITLNITKHNSNAPLLFFPISSAQVLSRGDFTFTYFDNNTPREYRVVFPNANEIHDKVVALLTKYHKLQTQSFQPTNFSTSTTSSSNVNPVSNEPIIDFVLPKKASKVDIDSVIPFVDVSDVNNILGDILKNQETLANEKAKRVVEREGKYAKYTAMLRHNEQKSTNMGITEQEKEYFRRTEPYYTMLQMNFPEEKIFQAMKMFPNDLNGMINYCCQ